MQIFGIEFSASQVWLLGAAGGCIVFLFQIWIARHSRRSAASAKFRGRMLEALKGLYPIPSAWASPQFDIDTHLKKVFPELQAAVEEFRPFLNKRNQARFDTAWRIFRVGEHSEFLEQFYWHYRPHTMSDMVDGEEVHFDNTNTYKSDFKSNVDTLMAFARVT